MAAAAGSGDADAKKVVVNNKLHDILHLALITFKLDTTIPKPVSLIIAEYCRGQSQAELMQSSAF